MVAAVCASLVGPSLAAARSERLVDAEQAAGSCREHYEDGRGHVLFPGHTGWPTRSKDGLTWSMKQRSMAAGHGRRLEELRHPEHLQAAVREPGRLRELRPAPGALRHSRGLRWRRTRRGMHVPRPAPAPAPPAPSSPSVYAVCRNTTRRGARAAEWDGLETPFVVQVTVA